jgi:hypothetical protein
MVPANMIDTSPQCQGNIPLISMFLKSFKTPAILGRPDLCRQRASKVQPQEHHAALVRRSSEPFVRLLDGSTARVVAEPSGSVCQSSQGLPLLDITDQETLLELQEDDSVLGVFAEMSLVNALG